MSKTIFTSGLTATLLLSTTLVQAQKVSNPRASYIDVQQRHAPTRTNQ